MIGWKDMECSAYVPEPRMARPRILLVGGHLLVAGMFIEHFHHGDRYELESVQYCDDALAALQCERFDLLLVLSLHVPWKRWPKWYSPARHRDLANALLFLKQMRALHHPPPVILISGSPCAEAEKEALAHGAFAFLPKPFNLTELDRLVVLALEQGERKVSHDVIQAVDRQRGDQLSARAAMSDELTELTARIAVLLARGEPDIVRVEVKRVGNEAVVVNVESRHDQKSCR